MFCNNILQLQRRKRLLHRVVLVSKRGKEKCFGGECRASDLLEDTRAFVTIMTVIPAVISHQTLSTVSIGSDFLYVVYVCFLLHKGIYSLLFMYLFCPA